jgi:hypothetical protein
MTVFQQVLWMYVKIRVLGKQPRLPSPRESDAIRGCIATAVQLHLHATWHGTSPRSGRYCMADR